MRRRRHKRFFTRKTPSGPQINEDNFIIVIISSGLSLAVLLALL